MSNVLNLLSEETFCEKLDMHNALLKAIVQQNGGTPNVDLSISSWSVVQQLVRLGVARNVFSVGDQLECQHSKFGTLVWDILAFDADTPENELYTHSMTLGLHDILPQPAQQNEMMTFDYLQSRNPSYLVSVSGSNEWEKSDIRQWLNSNGTAGTWWESQSEYDDEPPYAQVADGFLYGLDTDMVSALGNVKKITARNTVFAGEGYVETIDKVFLLSLTEVYAGFENNVQEGNAYSYYINNSTLSTPMSAADANRKKYQNGTAKNWCLRSPVATTPQGCQTVTTTGAIAPNPAANQAFLAPACCIV